MRAIIPSLLCISLLLPVPLPAETYSCTDSQGVRHIADNLMKLPAECRDQAQTHEDKDSGRVNYVPPLQKTPGQSQEFQRAVREAEIARQKKEREAAELVQQAEALAKTFDEAVSIRKKALRSRSYSSREHIRTADAMMEASRKEKASLVEKMRNTHLSVEQRRQIQTALDRIED